MDATSQLGNRRNFGEGFQPVEGQAHVLVALQPPPEPRDSTKEWLKELFTERIELHSMPLVGDLENFVKRPLPVKIRAKEKWLKNWSLNCNLQEKLFVVDEAAPCKEFKSKIFGKRQLTLLRSGGSKSSFVWAWDSLFRNVLDFIFPRAVIDRGSGNKTPDFMLMLEDVCVFRGEEEAPHVSIRVPSQKLGSRLVWAYGNVPFVFGYAASGYHIDLVALHLWDEDGVVMSTRIGAYNIELKEQRFEAVLALLNLSLLFPAIAGSCPLYGRDEFKVIKATQSGAAVRVYPTCVEKSVPDAARFDHLKRVYDQMERAGVPNVDRLTTLDFVKRTATFEPRGTAVRPSSLLELFGALRDVLEALVALHRLGWMHRDIRWANVIKQRERDSWLLIDFGAAATSPQPSSSGQHRLSVEEHAPEMFVDNGAHTAAVDVWAVGLLIKTSTVEWSDLAGGSAFYERLIAQDPGARPSAEEALREWIRLEEAARRELELGDIHGVPNTLRGNA